MHGGKLSLIPSGRVKLLFEYGSFPKFVNIKDWERSIDIILLQDNIDIANRSIRMVLSHYMGGSKKRVGQYSSYYPAIF